VSELSARLDLPLGTMAPTGARKTLRQLLITWGYTDRDWLDAGCVVMAELVTNAVLHGGGCLEVGVQAHEGTVMISAADGSSIVPRRKRGQRSGGLGLVLIDQLSAAWWVENHHGGKRVWVRLLPYPPSL
jgi:anti-sigma regulatory factor (Ser/Thr protein kinase)